MNNQKLIDELIYELENVSSKSINKDFEDGYNGGIRHALELVKEKKLDEPKKGVVPKFVADFIEDGNHYDKIAFLVHQKFLGVNSLMRECNVKDWLMSVDYETVLSLVNGYEVETEQLYYVFDTTTKQYLGVDKVLNKAFWLSSQNSGARTPLTEQEIKAIDERYWYFAVMVEGKK